MAAVVVGTLLLSVVAGLLMGRWTSVSAITGSLSLSAGGAAGVTSMSRDLGADERMVAVIQYLRVVLIVSTLPLVTAFVFRPPVADPSVITVAHGPGWVVDVTFTAVCALVGSLIAIRARSSCGHASRTHGADRRIDGRRVVVRCARPGLAGPDRLRRNRIAHRPRLHPGQPEVARPGAAGGADADRS